MPTGQTWDVECAACHRPKWPHLAENPGNSYVCVLCRLGGARQAAARRSAKGRKAPQARRPRAVEGG